MDDGFHVQDLEKASSDKSNGAEPKKKKPGKFDINRIRPITEWPTAQRILSILKEEGALTGTDMAKRMLNDGYAPATGSAILSKFYKEGHVRAFDGTNKDGRRVRLYCLAAK